MSVSALRRTRFEAPIEVSEELNGMREMSIHEFGQAVGMKFVEDSHLVAHSAVPDTKFRRAWLDSGQDVLTVDLVKIAIGEFRIPVYPQAFPASELSIAEMIHTLSRYPLALDWFSFTDLPKDGLRPYLTLLEDIRGFCEPDSALSYLVAYDFNMPKKYPQSPVTTSTKWEVGLGARARLVEFVSGRYSFDEAAPYMAIGVLDEKMIERAISDGISPDVFAAVATS